ncbi:hypothetical protein Scep_025440 [Stephania cephalantha]|uniref:Protein DEFECTIVE IN MERISTEM SILENCING 3-like n=1 Tax=Stephania cephalantha TaxID=152367 RepID=A0AAP0EI84_9MAGN
MFHQSNDKLPLHINMTSAQESLALMAVDNGVPSLGGNAHIDNLYKAECFARQSQKLQDDLESLGLKIKHHEGNLRFLKSQENMLDEYILDVQVSLGKYHSSSIGAQVENGNLDGSQSEENTIAQISQIENSAARVVCELKNGHTDQASNPSLINNVLGVVATLGKVEDDNLSRIFSEYLGLDHMLAIVCKSNEGIKHLEPYDQKGKINKSSGLHGLGSSFSKPLDGRFLVICLEDLRPYVGELAAGDPQKKLALPKPRLPNGTCPSGFIDFAVNMINVEIANSSCLTASGLGLRETLFYSLFSRLQVYKTRMEMMSALPCISNGALSLDGGMIKRTGFFSLGSRKEVEVRFPITSETSNLPVDYIKAEEKIKISKWQKERICDDMKREQLVLNLVKQDFDSKKKLLVSLLSKSSSYA